MSDYVLGSSDHELVRLELQQRVWGGYTERLLDRVHVAPGARVLDVGCGPGFVIESLRARAGTTGRVVALDESKRWLTHLARVSGEHGWRNVHLLEGKLEQVALEPASFDVVFARWVLSFLPDLAGALDQLARALRPGGALVVQDYNHEGISLFPESEGFRAVVRATRALYASKGGNVWVAAKLPAASRAAGLEPVELVPHVIAGAPGSPAFTWADAFFPYHSQAMREAGLLSAAECETFRREWEQRKLDPDALFFSPIVVDFVARKPRAAPPARHAR